ncbi:hypothetical protein D3C79_728970 [compost metagenome]
MRAAAGINQLAGDTHLVAGLAHAAFKHVAHTQLLADTLHVHRPALVGKTGVAGDDEQPAQARQGSNDVFDHAVGEVVLLGVAAEVVERQHGDRRFVWQVQYGGWRRQWFG